MKKTDKILPIGTWLDLIEDYEIENLFGRFDVQSKRIQLVHAMHELAALAEQNEKRILVVEDNQNPYEVVEIGENTKSWKDVTSEWICLQMLDYKLSDEQVYTDLNISKGDLSAYKSGSKNLSMVRKQAFYYYFYRKAAEQFIED